MPALPEPWQIAGFGLYVHWPYCLSKCPYCDFNSHVAAKVDAEAMLRVYLGEIAQFAALTGPRRLSSIFFGGGTPSLMPPDVVDAIVDAATNAWTPANDIEITLEANPTSVEAARFDAFRAAGVNRVSLGLQALDDDDLRALGRLHTVDESLRALEVAQHRFERVSFDLIYARQGQTLAAWQAELSRALSFGTSHLSLYQLTIEDGTAFGDRHRRGLLRGLPDEDLAADLYALTQEMTGAVPAYEVSNHAMPGEESRHNLIYWRGGDWAGIGPGAHGRLTLSGTRHSTETPRAPAAWLSSSAPSPAPLTDREAAEEYLMMSLRLTEGADLSRFGKLAGSPPDTSALEAEGLVVREGDRLTATSRGRLLLNSVIAALLA
jgi:putative oxygen-independent coproporphyrinogen III oxidase